MDAMMHNRMRRTDKASLLGVVVCHSCVDCIIRNSQRLGLVLAKNGRSHPRLSTIGSHKHRAGRFCAILEDGSHGRLGVIECDIFQRFAILVGHS